MVSIGAFLKNRSKEDKVITSRVFPKVVCSKPHNHVPNSKCLTGILATYMLYIAKNIITFYTVLLYYMHIRL